MNWDDRRDDYLGKRQQQKRDDGGDHHSDYNTRNYSGQEGYSRGYQKQFGRKKYY